MAGIDKIYLKTYTAYKEFLEWAKKANIEHRKLLQEHGVDDLSAYIRQDVQEDYFKWGEFPVCNNVYFLDIFFIKFCPIQEVQDRLKVMYGKDYDKEELYLSEYYKPICKRVKVIYPHKHKRNHPTCSYYPFDLDFDWNFERIENFYCFCSDNKWRIRSQWCGDTSFRKLRFKSVKAAVKFLLKTAPVGVTFRLIDYASLNNDIILKTY